MEIESLIIIILSIYFIFKGLTFNENTIDYKRKQVTKISKYIRINKKSYISLGILLILSSFSYLDIVTNNIAHIYLKIFRILCGILLLSILIFYKNNIKKCISENS